MFVKSIYVEDWLTVRTCKWLDVIFVIVKNKEKNPVSLSHKIDLHSVVISNSVRYLLRKTQIIIVIKYCELERESTALRLQT